MIKETLLAASLMAGANIVDYHTSNVALKNPDNYEGNPIIGPRGERLTLVKGVTVAAETIIFIELRKRNKKLAWGFVATSVATRVAIGIANGRKK